MTETVKQGEPYRYPLKFKIDGQLQDLTNYTLEIKVVDKGDGSVPITRSVTDRSQDNLSFIVIITAAETSGVLDLGYYKVCHKLRNSDDSIIETTSFDLLVGKSCF